MKRITSVVLVLVLAMASMSYAAELDTTHAKKPVHARVHKHVRKHKAAAHKAHSRTAKSKAASQSNNGVIKNSF